MFSESPCGSRFSAPTTTRRGHARPPGAAVRGPPPHQCLADLGRAWIASATLTTRLPAWLNAGKDRVGTVPLAMPVPVRHKEQYHPTPALSTPEAAIFDAIAVPVRVGAGGAPRLKRSSRCIPLRKPVDEWHCRPTAMATWPSTINHLLPIIPVFLIVVGLVVFVDSAT